ncbi:MAG: DUF2934 domain-containing protein [Rhodospirillales bacterium]|nr:DUF2934 domain-containing protein [Rhodospirillales bacterium]
MTQQDHDEIVERAHAIWEREGRPEGQAEEHWQRAVAELQAEEAERIKAEEAAAKAKAEAAAKAEAEAAAKKKASEEAAKAEQAEKQKSDEGCGHAASRDTHR